MALVKNITKRFLLVSEFTSVNRLIYPDILCALILTHDTTPWNAR